MTGDELKQLIITAIRNMNDEAKIGRLLDALTKHAYNAGYKAALQERTVNDRL